MSVFETFIVLYSTGFHILFLSFTIRCYSFKSYQVHSWKPFCLSMHECCYVIIKVSDIWNNQSPSTATNSEDGIDHYDDGDDDDDDDDSLYLNIYYLILFIYNIFFI